MKIKKRKRLI